MRLVWHRVKVVYSDTKESDCIYIKGLWGETCAHVLSRLKIASVIEIQGEIIPHYVRQCANHSGPFSLSGREVI